MPPLQVNIDDPDFERHPLFQFARPSQCILEPGEVLFVPAGSGILVFFFLRVVLRCLLTPSLLAATGRHTAWKIWKTLSPCLAILWTRPM